MKSNPLNLPKKIKIVAHRGGSITLPENTLAAFKQALEDGADAFECDVSLTKDGEPVIIHIPFYSDDISTLAGKAAKVGKMGWAEIKRLRIKGEPIPHLYHVLDFLSTNSIECFIEPKRNSLEMIEKIVRGITSYALIDKVHLLTFFSRRKLLIHAKKINPNLKTSMIFVFPFGHWGDIAQAAGSDMVVPGWKKFNHLRALDGFLVDLKKKVVETQAQGISVYSGIADDEKNIRWLSDIGVDGIFTNNVRLAKRLLSGYE